MARGDLPDPLGPLRDLDGQGADPRFVDRLEADLRIAHAETAPRRVAPWRRVAVLAPALALLVVIATTTLVLRDDSASAALELTDARGVVVTLPDGTTVIDPSDGFALVDGAMVVVAADGTATIDDVALEAGATVTVRDGTLVTDVVGTTTSAPDESRSSGDDPNETAVGPPPTDPTTEPTTTLPPTTTLAAPSSTRPVPPDDRPVEVAPPPVDPSPEPTPPDDRLGQVPTDPAPADGVDLALRLRVRSRDRDVLVAWRTDGADGLLVRTVLLRRVGDGSPDWPVADGTVVLAETDGSRPGELIDDVGGDAPVHYRIVVLDVDDGVVAQSGVQTLADP